MCQTGQKKKKKKAAELGEERQDEWGGARITGCRMGVRLHPRVSRLRVAPKLVILAEINMKPGGSRGGVG